jgi:hypothetical protein
MSQANNERAEVRKAGRSKVFYAAAGAGDMAMEALRAFGGRLAELQEKADWADLSGRVFEYVTLAGAKAVQLYDELAERGKEVAAKAGPPPAAAQLEQAARSTANATIAAANRTADAARKGAQTAARAAGQAAGATTAAAAPLRGGLGASPRARRADGRQTSPQQTSPRQTSPRQTSPRQTGNG